MGLFADCRETYHIDGDTISGVLSKCVVAKMLANGGLEKFKVRESDKVVGISVGPWKGASDEVNQWAYARVFNKDGNRRFRLVPKEDINKIANELMKGRGGDLDLDNEL